METPENPQKPDPGRPRNIFFASVILFVVYLVLLNGLGLDIPAINIAGWVFLIWSIVAAVRARKSKPRA